MNADQENSMVLRCSLSASIRVDLRPESPLLFRAAVAFGEFCGAVVRTSAGP
jgi:hypothetical protein